MDPADAQCEGWLVKKGQKRYFLLANSALTWKSHPLGSVRKSVDLYRCDIQKGDEECSIIIKPSTIVPTFRKVYALEAKDSNEANAWYQQLRRAIEIKTKEDAIKEGWLDKKNRRRWFMLLKKDDVLYWFAKEQDASSDFTKNVKGRLPMSLVKSVEVMATGFSKQKPTFKIETTVPGLNYVLTARVWSDMEEWVATLNGLAAGAGQRESERADRDFLHMEKRGYLTKKGKKRYFVLSKDSSNRFTLQWFLNEKSPNSKGCVLMDSCSAEYPSDQKSSFVIAVTNGKRYELSAKNKQEARLWMLKVAESISRSRFKSSGAAACPTPVHKDASEDVEQIRSTAAPQSSKQGWLIKKGRRRFFYFSEDTVVWLEAEPEHIANKGEWIKNIKGSITLGPGCSASLMHHPFSFYIETAQGYQYTLTASTTREASEWVDVLRRRLAVYPTPAPLTEGVAADVRAPVADKQKKWCTFGVRKTYQQSSSSSEVVQCGWISKKGKRRWLVLTNGGELMWYEKEQSASNVDSKPKGSMSLVGCSVKEVDEATFIIFSPFGASYTFDASSLKNKELWVSSINLCTRKANLVEEKLAEEWRFREQCGWLEKKGQRRWFVLRDTGFLYWFATQQSHIRITAENAKGHLDLRTCVMACEEGGSRFTLTLRHTREGGNIKTLVLCAKSDAEMREWADGISHVIRFVTLSTSQSSSVNSSPGTSFSPDEGSASVLASDGYSC